MTLRFLKNSLLLTGTTALLASCHHDVVVVPEALDYFPTVVGTFRSYAVADSTWTNGVVTVSGYQLRERVTEQFTDAAGQLAYRLVRSRRANASAAWADDSVLVVQKTTQVVLVTRNNVRTVDLLYPARAGRAWNATAYTIGTATPDTITNTTRAYLATVGGAHTTPALGSAAPKAYDTTVQTKSTLPNGVDDANVYYQRGLQQVYASGVGLVQRRRYSYQTYTGGGSGTQQVPTPGIRQNGNSRFEVLLETGKF